MQNNKTYIPNAEAIEKKVYLVDAKDKILGRVAAKAAHILRGKHKKIYTPHLDTGDTVVIINAEKIKVTGKKMTDKIYQRYTGYPSGRRDVTLGEMLKNAPTQVLRLAIDRMIPPGPLGNKIRTHVKIYAGDKHPHQAQKPIPLDV
jgi:large subunit ribosomal protein L13